MARLLDPFGIQLTDVRRVMVFVEESDGKMHGWEVLGGSASYRLTGHPGGSAHAVIAAAGEFHRIAKDNHSLAIENAMRTAAIDAAALELEAGD